MPWRGNNEDMNNCECTQHNLTGLPTPVDNTDAANKEYVDTVTKNAVNKNYVDSRTRVFGFRIHKTISHENYITHLQITVPTDIHPDQIIVLANHPALDGIRLTSADSGTNNPTIARYSIQFSQTYRGTIIMYGLIYILPNRHLTVIDNSSRVNINIDTQNNLTVQYVT
jgi:hypothetical protein